ncbi:MAG: peptidoglycan DD-metalloendopeptidase family protein, partial [Bacteroidia bacterium]|nr:peptidoglycan DD-metalloendopeptidase family protein [Bacteroidia bacterium]
QEEITAPTASTQLDSEQALNEIYGIDLSDLKIHKGTIKNNETLGAILDRYGILPWKTEEIARSSESVFSVKKLMAGKPYYMICSADSNETARYFVYHRSAIEKVIFDLGDSTHAQIFKQTPDTIRHYADGIIEQSLYMSIVNSGAPIELAMSLADIYAWEIDFFRIQKNDEFKVIYDELVIDNVSVGIDKILACEFKHKGTVFPAYYFLQEDGHSYFDNEGQSLQKAFLKAPLNFTRISSRYSKRRFHPIQKRFKAHLGTDYAAPTGTPIKSVGDGEIIAARYTRNNGNYVKVKHNQTYTTQYLHMSKIASGIRNGVRVKQGQTIGYVGSTGLATGPHLCFRFWKNGKQVDPLTIKMPPSKPLDPKYLDDFNRDRSDYDKMLQNKALFIKPETARLDTL